jgi:multiple sugar transport system substrate-binding protein
VDRAGTSIRCRARGKGTEAAKEESTKEIMMARRGQWTIGRLVLFAASGLVLGCGGTREGQPVRPTVTIAVYAAGKQGAISGPLYHWKDQWEGATGAQLAIVEVPYAQLYERIMADARSGGGEFDGVVAPSFMYGDFIEHQYILPIDEFRSRPGFPNWDEKTVVPPIAALHQWNSVWYGCPNDADGHILYYRKDVLSDPENQRRFHQKTGRELRLPPRTWEELAEIAEAFAGVDWNGNGRRDDFGIALHLKGGGQGYWHYMSLSAPYVVLPGPAVTRFHNVYAFDPETMAPIVDSPGHVRALEMLRRLARTGSPDQTAWGLEEAWDSFLRGNALFCFSWGDLGRLAQDEARSAVRGKLGCSVLPGTLEVWDRQHRRWQKFDRPNLIANTSGASWHGVICKASKHPDLVYHLFAFHAEETTNMFNIAQGWSGIDPGRTYQFLAPQGEAKIEDYTRYGFDPNDVKEYTYAYYENYYLTGARLEYLRVPGTSRFHMALDEELSAALADPSSPAAAVMQRVAEKWRGILADFERGLGPGRLRELYRQSIGYRPTEGKGAAP